VYSKSWKPIEAIISRRFLFCCHVLSWGTGFGKVRSEEGEPPRGRFADLYIHFGWGEIMQKVYLVAGAVLCAIVGVLRAQCEAEVVESFVGEASDAALVGDLLYVANGRGGVRILDMSDPTRPVKLGGVRPPVLQQVTTFNAPVDGAQVIKVEGNYAYVADRSSGLVILDITNPTNPAILSTLPQIRRIDDLRVEGDLVYVIQGSGSGGLTDGFVVVDASDRQQPAIIGSLPLSRRSTMSLEVIGSVALVGSTGWFQIRLIDISDPTQPVEILPAYQDIDPVHAMQRAGNRLYVAGNGQFTIFDCTDPLNLQLIGRQSLNRLGEPPAGVARDLAIKDELVYLTGAGQELVVLDISNPQEIMIVTQNFFGLPNIATQGRKYGIRLGIAVEGGVAYLCGGFDGVTAVDLTDIQAPQKLSNQITPPFMQSIAVRDGIAYGAADYFGMITMDVSDPRNISSAGLAQGFPTQIFNMALGDNNAFATRGSRLFAYDVTNPVQPAEISSLSVAGSFLRAIRVQGQTAYMATGTRLVAADVSNPAQMSVLSATNLPQPLGLDIVGSLAYASGLDGLTIVDFADPANPVPFPPYGSGFTGVAVEGKYAYCTSLDGLRILNVADPLNPAPVSSLSLVDAVGDITVSDGIAYIKKYGDSEVGLYIVDISRPAAPVLLSVVDNIDGRSGSFFYDNGFVYMTNYFGGLQVVDVSSCVAAPPCPGNIADEFGTLDPDDQVGFGDFLALLGLIGPCPDGVLGCTGDIADDMGALPPLGGPDGQIDLGDFIALMGLMGPCP
jgi:hypothetical protein